MRVFEAEALEVDFGVAVGHIILVAIRVKEEIGRVEHPDTTTSPARPR